MSTRYTYSLQNDTLNGEIDLRSLHNTIVGSNITIVLEGVTLSGDSILIDFKADLSASEQSELLSLVQAHTGESESTSTTIDNNVNKYLKIEASNTEIRLPALWEDYQTLYQYSGIGKLIGFTMDFDSDNILIKLTIDGEEVFNLDLDVIESMVYSNDDEKYTRMLGYLGWSKSQNTISFYPQSPIIYTSEIKIEAKANYNNYKRDMQSYLIQLTKES